jgi:cellulose synthase/poly-beta-1,6-N-acetylglucosamine synthase-like glycosyltransferase
MSVISSVVLGLTLLLLIQSAFATYTMFYSFLDEEKLEGLKSSKQNYPYKYKHTFSILLPARHEEMVIGDTLAAMAKLSYPKNLYEVLVLVRSDDTATINKVNEVLKSLSLSNFRLIVVDGEPVNKPGALNIGRFYAQNEIVAVFDAEDEPHPSILKTVDATFTAREVDVVQAGIQLINVDSHWFSALNCLEYYYWFKSILPFFAKHKVIPLGGNTVFIKKKALESVDGWDDHCLTEDADIGIRLSARGFKTAAIYDESLATLEETPVNTSEFLKQRTRWTHGYLQILLKGEWLKFSTLSEQLLMLYILSYVIFRQVSAVMMVLLPVFSYLVKVPLGLAIFSFLPVYFLFLQWGLGVIGLLEIRKKYNLRFSLLAIPDALTFYFPYQFVLFIAGLRALLRLNKGLSTWEKTTHLNMHRLANSFA